MLGLSAIAVFDNGRAGKVSVMNVDSYSPNAIAGRMVEVDALMAPAIYSVSLFKVDIYELLTTSQSCLEHGSHDVCSVVYVVEGVLCSS